MYIVDPSGRQTLSPANCPLSTEMLRRNIRVQGLYRNVSPIETYAGNITEHSRNSKEIGVIYCPR